MKGVIRVGCADRSRSARTAIEKCLEGQPDLRLVGSWTKAESAMPAVIKAELDLLLLAMELPGQSGLESLREIRKTQPRLKVIITADPKTRPDALDVVRAGAYGLLVKPVADDCLIGAIRSAHRGRTVFCVQARRQVIDACLGVEPCSELPTGRQLSRREREVLQLLREGYTDQQIAALMGVSLNTEKEYLKNAYKKLGVHSRVQAVKQIDQLNLC